MKLVLLFASVLVCVSLALAQDPTTTTTFTMPDATTTTTTTTTATETDTTTEGTTTTTPLPPQERVKIFSKEEMLFMRGKGVVFETINETGFPEQRTSINDLLDEIASLKNTLAQTKQAIADAIEERTSALGAQLSASTSSLLGQVSALTDQQASAAVSLGEKLNLNANSLGASITTTSDTITGRISAGASTVTKDRSDLDARITASQASLSTAISAVDQRTTSSATATNTEIGVVKSIINTKVDTAAYTLKTDGMAAQVSTLTSRADGFDAAVSSIRVSISKDAADTASTAVVLSATKSDVDRLAVPLKLEVQSAGYCVGNYFNIWINDNIAAVNAAAGPAFGRGINTLTVDAVTGTALVRNTFDTCCGANPAGEVARLISYLNSLPAGQIVLFGIIDEGVQALTDEARRVIAGFGSKLIGHINFRESWAMIGVKGATPGSVPEDHGGDDYNPNCPVPATGRATAKLQGQFFSGKLAWYNTEYMKRGALEGFTKVQRKVIYTIDTARDTWAGSRQMAFNKYHDDSILKITWFDNFRCEGTGGVACRWDVYIDGFMCVSDGQFQTGPIRMDIYYANSLNHHRGDTVVGYCKALHNGAILRAGSHLLQVWERGSPQHTHGNPYLGWNWATDYPGGTPATAGGTYAAITIEEVF